MDTSGASVNQANDVVEMVLQAMDYVPVQAAKAACIRQFEYDHNVTFSPDLRNYIMRQVSLACAEATRQSYWEGEQ